MSGHYAASPRGDSVTEWRAERLDSTTKTKYSPLNHSCRYKRATLSTQLRKHRSELVSVMSLRLNEFRGKIE